MSDVAHLKDVERRLLVARLVGVEHPRGADRLAQAGDDGSLPGRAV